MRGLGLLSRLRAALGMGWDDVICAPVSRETPGGSMRLKSAVAHEDRVAVDWEEEGSSQFHHVWLRDNCLCSECRHPDAWEHTVDTFSIPLDIRPEKVEAGDALDITWSDGHLSTFSADWLLENAYDSARIQPEAQITLWDGESIHRSLPEVEYASIIESDEGALAWLKLVREYGFAIVRGVPTEHQQVMELARYISYISPTNFGLWFDVESKPDPENLAYTAVRLAAHNDVPNREALPGLQFLHCLVFDADGGESILVDGFQAAEILRTEHPDDFELLRTVAVPYRYLDADNDVSFSAPMIGLDHRGDYWDIRHNNAIMAPLDIDPNLVPAYYRAYQNFSSILYRPELEYEFKMQPGDCQVFNNRRVLHARAAFDPNSGPRHFQGCYVDMDDFLSRLRVLERRGADFRRT